MAVMQVYEHEGMVLTYDTDDVEDFELATPSDVIDITPPGATSYKRKLGQAHLSLTVHFKPGKRALWIKKEELNHG